MFAVDKAHNLRRRALQLYDKSEIMQMLRGGSDHDSMAHEMRSEPAMEWIVLIPDIEGSLETRMRVRE
jgi:hypothetical protein